MLAVLLLVIPLFAAVVVAAGPAGLARGVSFVASLAALGVAIIAAIDFDGWGIGGWGLSWSSSLLPEYGIALTLGADSVSMMLVLLTAVLMPLAMLGSWTAVQHRVREYYAWLLVLATAMTGVFLARDLLVFYVCFEFTLVPMYFLIAIYGSSNRAWASVKFFIYTFTGSLFTLAGFVYVAWQFKETSIYGNWSFGIHDLIAFSATL